jgi:putative hydrolase of the HAD superfamily
MTAKIRWVLFDAVGTLIFADPPAAEVYCDAARRFGFAAAPDVTELRFRRALEAETAPTEGTQCPPTSESLEYARWRRIVGSVFPDVSPPASEQLFAELWQHFAVPEHWRLYPDVEPSLCRLRKQEVKLGIASNFDGRLRPIAAGIPALAAMDAVFLSSQVGYVKPDPRFFQAVAGQLLAEPAEILLVGDDWLADVQGARAAGWQAIWLDRSGHSEDKRSIASLDVLTIC